MTEIDNKRKFKEVLKIKIRHTRAHFVYVSHGFESFAFNSARAIPTRAVAESEIISIG